MRPDVLFHVVLARERLVADRTVYTLLSGMLLPVPRGMSGSRKRRRTAMTGGERTRVFVLSRLGGQRVLGATDRRGRGRRVGHRVGAQPFPGVSRGRCRIGVGVGPP